MILGFSHEMVAKENEKKSLPGGVSYGYESDYDRSLTKLYSYIESKKWKEALQQIESSPNETTVWVYRKQKENGNMRWRLLPLHAAIIFKAPEEIIESLLIKNPYGAKCKDDQGSIPLHLAIRNRCSKVIVNLLIMTYPKSIETPDRKSRFPLTLAQLLPVDELRDSYISAIQYATSYLKIIEAKEMKTEEERLGLIKKVESRDIEISRTKEHMLVVNNHAKKLEVQTALASETIKSTERKAEAQRISLTNKIQMLDKEFTRIKEHHANQMEVKAALVSASLQSVEKKADTERLRLTEKIEALEAEVARTKQSTEKNNETAERQTNAERLRFTEKIEALEDELVRTKQSTEKKYKAAERQADTERLRLTAKIESLEDELVRTKQSTEKNNEAIARKSDAERLRLTEKIEALEGELARTKEATRTNNEAIERKAATERLRLTERIEALEDEPARTAQSAEVIAEAEQLSLTEKVEAIELELARTKENEIVVDKLNQLEDQLKSRTETERLLATKIIALDAMVKDISQSKDIQMEFTSKNKQLQKEKADAEKFAKKMADEIAILRDTVSKQEVMISTQSNAKERIEAKIRYLKKELSEATSNSVAMTTQRETVVKEDKKAKNKHQRSKLTIRKSGTKQKESGVKKKESGIKQKGRCYKSIKVKG